MNFSLTFEYSPLLLIPAIILAALLSLLLYRKEERISKNIRIVLFALRFVLFTLLFILLINPIIKHFENRIEKPAFVIALDNSSSLGTYLETEPLEILNNSFQSLKKSALERDISLEIVNLNDEVLDINDSLTFDSKKTDLSSMLKNIDKRYENRNLSGILLISDGLFNRGVSPLYMQYSNRISTLGLGDTSTVKDVWINDIQYNEVAFLDNYFPIKVSIQQNGFENTNVKVQILSSGTVLKEETLIFKQNESLKSTNFKVLAKNTGQQRLRIKAIAQNEDPKRQENNVRDIYLEIIDGKDKVLVLSLNPHPDIKAIKDALSKSLNYDVISVSLATEVMPEEKFDLVIMHQIPNLQNVGNAYVRKFIEKEVPIWFILGPSSDYYNLNREFKGININARVRQMDDVNPYINPDFQKFKLPDNTEQLIPKLPPIEVPFANFELGEGSEIILYQAVNRINTGKPLLAIQQVSNNKFGMLLGDGLWAWRMHEYSINENFEFTDALINKMVQFLSLKEDKRKFRIRIKNEDDLYESNTVFFESEIYNDIFEPIFGNKIQMKVRNESGAVTEYNFTNSKDREFGIKGLEPGIYSYNANTEVDNKNYQVKGQFSIRKMELELLSSQADFNLLKRLAESNGGDFFTSINEENIDQILGNESKGIIHSREVNIDFISLYWIFFVGLLLITIEWFIRKYSGTY
ncbi:hypothetical protein HZR84_10875 [Hyphobacterium sp. CCMP332]|nr:hypothetical protein HZR84_10875 [Hyphobacterium sp. CCMP332]